MMTALSEPFAVGAVDEQRLLMVASLIRVADFPGLCRGAIAPFESHVPWTQGFLDLRRTCYAETSDRRLAHATRDLVEFVSREPLPLGTGITTTPTISRR